MEKDKRHLPQIKLFEVTYGVEEIVNDYVIEIFNETGNSPRITHAGNYISVICDKLVETNYQIERVS